MFRKRQPMPKVSQPVPAAKGTATAPTSQTPTPLLADLFAEPLSLAHSLMEGQDLGDPALARQKMLAVLDDVGHRATAAGFAAAQAEAARFAVVALLDEAVLSSQWKGRAAWRGNPLQRELFGINTAGEEFFTRLDTARQDMAANRDVVEVYYACLIMGFEGRFRVLGRDKLSVLLGELAAELTARKARGMDDLSPSWKRPDDFPDVAGGGVPVWVSIGVLIGSIALVVVLFALAARISADHEAGKIRQYYYEVTDAREAGQ